MKRSLLVLLLVGLTACGAAPTAVDETQNWSAEKIYNTAMDELHAGNYTKSVKLFETLEARYPYGRFAQQAQLEVAYAYYKDNEAVSAVAACDRFIKLHPNSPNIDYVYYLKGLANFTQDKNLLSVLANQDITERDPNSAISSFNAFHELTTRFPDSKYTPDALARMKYLVNVLGWHEIHIAHYYYNRQAYIAAINRVQYSLTHYPQAPANEQGLAIMVRSYDAMKMPGMRDDTQRILEKNFPNSQYLKGNLDPTKPWWQFWTL